VKAHIAFFGFQKKRGPFFSTFLFSLSVLTILFSAVAWGWLAGPLGIDALVKIDHRTGKRVIVGARAKNTTAQRMIS